MARGDGDSAPNDSGAENLVADVVAEASQPDAKPDVETDAGCVLVSATTLTAAGYPGSVVSDNVNVYFTNYYGTGPVESIPRGGGMTTTLASSRPGPYGVAVDSKYVYWVEEGNADGDGHVMKALKTGGGTPITIASNLMSPQFIQFDGTNLYWTTLADADAGGGVWTSLPNEDASATMIGSPQSNPVGIALDADKVVYWIAGYDRVDSGTVVKWDPDGGTVSTLASGQGGTVGIGVSAADHRVYWTNEAQGTVVYTSTTATQPPAAPTTLATDPQGPRGLFVDAPDASNPTSLVVYWTDFVDPGTVWYSKNGRQCPLSTEESVPQGLFVDDTYVYWTNYVGSGAVRRAPKIQ
jgi:hypothetical protein